MTSVKLHLILEYVCIYDIITKKAEDNLCSSVIGKMIVIFYILPKSAQSFPILQMICLWALTLHDSTKLVP